MVEHEPFVVDHVLIEPPPEEICPYEGCGASVWEIWAWSEVREADHEIPKIPERDKVYKVTWSSVE